MILSTQTDPPVHLLAGFAHFFPDRAPELVVQAPGRSLWGAVARRTDEQYSLASVEWDVRVSFNYQSAKQRRTLMRRPLPHWSRYAAGVLVLLCNSGVDPLGFDVVFAGDERDSGRYEYAVGVGFGAIHYTLDGRAMSEHALVDLTERVRREYISPG